MIKPPQRSVTRFFIPLIDVMTLLFCIFLIMPMVKATGGAGATDAAPAERVTDSERQELDRLRQEKQAWGDREALDREREGLEKEVQKLRQAKIETLQDRLSIRVLEIGDDGRLFYYDPTRPKDRRVEVTGDNVGDLIAEQRRQAGGHEPYFLFLYPRPTSGNPAFPLRGQREEYDRWFKGVAHGYDIAVQGR